MARRPRFADSVFINCPFDKDYWPLLEAIVFCVLDCGFTPRSALEASDAGEARINKICRLVGQSQYGIHDISRIELGAESLLPRFNMPFELGLDFGAKTFGTTQQKRKQLLVLDAKPYRYQASISDIAGQDIRVHNNSPDEVINVVRHWLMAASRRRNVPPVSAIRRHFIEFGLALPQLCDENQIDRDDIQFVEYVALAVSWLTASSTQS